VVAFFEEIETREVDITARVRDRGAYEIAIETSDEED